VLQHGLFNAGEKILLRPAQIARMVKEYSWIAGHSKDCSMGLVGIARSEITVLDAVTLMLSRKQRKNERRRSKSQHPGLPGLHRRLAARKSKSWTCRTFR